MDSHRQITDLIKAYIMTKYGDAYEGGATESEVKNFICDFMLILKQYNVLTDFKLVTEKPEIPNLLTMSLYYSITGDPKTYMLSLGF